MEIEYVVFLLMSSLLITLICLLVYGYHIDKRFEKIEEKIANLRMGTDILILNDLTGLDKESED